MEGILNRLADLILKEMDKKNCSMTCFAGLCGVNRNELGQIVNRQKSDVRISIICKICDNSEINIADVFGIDCSIESYFLTNGKDKYVLKKV